MPWAKIDYNKCDLCRGFTKLCMQQCPGYAYRLMQDRETKKFYIIHNSRACIGCKMCASACPKGAIEIIIATFPERWNELRIKSYAKMKKLALQMLA